jgi:hypothetical protein
VVYFVAFLGFEEKMIRFVTDETKLDAAAEAILDTKSKDEVLKPLEL